MFVGENSREGGRRAGEEENQGVLRVQSHPAFALMSEFHPSFGPDQLWPPWGGLGRFVSCLSRKQGSCSSGQPSEDSHTDRSLEAKAHESHSETAPKGFKGTPGWGPDLGRLNSSPSRGLSLFANMRTKLSWSQQNRKGPKALRISCALVVKGDFFSKLNLT